METIKDTQHFLLPTSWGLGPSVEFAFCDTFRALRMLREQEGRKEGKEVGREAYSFSVVIKPYENLLDQRIVLMPAFLLT